MADKEVSDRKEGTELADHGALVDQIRISPWTKNHLRETQVGLEILNGVATLQIPEEVFDDAELLWKSFVVSYFIGDAPHVGSIHGTVNRIWSSQTGSKIDVQFIAKNTVLFRVENKTATSPPDLSAMPLWVDLRGVPNGLFSHKGLKCLSRAVGKFVKLHPTRERCTSLDVAHVLVEVDLHQPLLERIGWGHRGSECRDKIVRILKKQTVEDAVVESANAPAQSPENSGFVDLLKELENLPARANATAEIWIEEVRNDEAGESGVMEGVMIEDSTAILLFEPTTEGFSEAAGGSWTTVYGSSHIDDSGSKEVKEIEESGVADVVISPSRFSPLLGIEDTCDDDLDATEGDLEEGEVVELSSSGFGTGNPWNSDLKLTSPRSSSRSVLYPPPKASMKTSLLEDSLGQAHVLTPQPHRTSTGSDDLAIGNRGFPLLSYRTNHVPRRVMYSSLLLQTVSTGTPFAPYLAGHFFDSDAVSFEDGFVSSRSRPVVSPQASDEYNRIPVDVPCSFPGGLRVSASHMT
ncbi:hypothetical protein Bca4012_065877 [Brassica carinata]